MAVPTSDDSLQPSYYAKLRLTCDMKHCIIFNESSDFI